MITFKAYKGTGFISKLIMLFSNGKFSHISIIIDGLMYEASMNKGVIMSLYTGDGGYETETREVKITDKNKAEVVKFLESQIGKKYDYRGIYAFLMPLAKPKMGSWYCSELAMVSLGKALGKPDIYEEQLVSPQEFWNILELIV